MSIDYHPLPHEPKPDMKPPISWLYVATIAAAAQVLFIVIPGCQQTASPPAPPLTITNPPVKLILPEQAPNDMLIAVALASATGSVTCVTVMDVIKGYQAGWTKWGDPQRQWDNSWVQTRRETNTGLAEMRVVLHK